MMNIHDVAAYILQKQGPMSALKLQKLVYYSQAWSLAWDDKPLFEEEIQAWSYGPVAPALYDMHRGKYQITAWSQGDPDNLDATSKETIDRVLNFYGNRSPQWLSDLSHREDPWMLARKGLKIGEPGQEVISLESMANYYSSILDDEPEK